MTTYQNAFFMREFINQIEDDVLREQMEAALRRFERLHRIAEVPLPEQGNDDGR